MWKRNWISFARLANIRRWGCCCFICFLWLHYVNVFDMKIHLKAPTNAWSDQKRPVFQLRVRDVECSTTMGWRELFVCTSCIKSAMDWINDFLQWSWFWPLQNRTRICKLLLS
jgi:hypothetical protein